MENPGGDLTKLWLQTIREASGVRLFNSLKKAYRNISKVGIDDFKAKLDRYLESISDELNMENQTPNTCSQTNPYCF